MEIPTAEHTVVSTFNTFSVIFVYFYINFVSFYLFTYIHFCKYKLTLKKAKADFSAKFDLFFHFNK